jgi:hypothetical protein
MHLVTLFHKNNVSTKPGTGILFFDIFVGVSMNDKIAERKVRRSNIA